jgi:hypothetical protein
MLAASTWGTGTVDESLVEGWTPGSPQPFVNTRYQLAGGMDTPSMAAARAAEAEDSHVYADAGYRKSLGDVERPVMMKTRRGLWAEQEGPSYFPDDIGRDGNGRGRWGNSGYAVSPRSEGWSKAAFQVAGAVVGKVWEFCKNSGAVFSGFRAGGGTGYKITPSNSAHFEAIAEHRNWQEKDENPGRESTPLPGGYPNEELEYIVDYMDRATPESTPPRASKRRQVSYSSKADEIAKNWVVVPPTAPAPSTPTRTQSRIPSKGPAKYTMPTTSSTSRRSVLSSGPARPTSRASFAPSVSTPRRPGLASHASNPARLSHTASPAITLNRGASYASPRGSPSSKIPRPSTPSHGSRHGGNAGTSFMGQGVGSPSVESPATKEAKRWAAIKRKEEREADESIRRLDAQLKAMIREGKEALGTKIEVELEDDPPMRPNIRQPKKWAF